MKDSKKKTDSNSDNEVSEKDIKSKIPRKSKSSNFWCQFLLLTNVLTAAYIAYLFKTLNKEKVYSDCTDYFKAGNRDDGVYMIQPTEDPKSAFNVYCNMTAGGWTAIMKRDQRDKRTSFRRPLANYKTGFGDLSFNHFLGLDKIHLMTITKVRDMMFFVDDAPYKVHDFRVTNQQDHYKLVVMKDIDEMPHSCSFTKLNNTYFSALDVDFDLALNGNCSEAWDGGWWYTNCFDASVCMTGLGMHNSVGVHRFEYSVMLIK